MGFLNPFKRKDKARPKPINPPDFVLVDVETANSKQGSICQIAVCHVEAGSISETWTTLVDPQGHFSKKCMRIHGITPQQVIGASTWPDVYPEAQRRLAGLVVSHSLFDKSAVLKACRRHGLDPILCREWRDSTTLVRRTWPDRYSRRGYALANLAKDFSLELHHHDALSDAICAANVVLKAFKSGASMDLWRHGQTGRRSWSPHVYTPNCRQDGLLGAEVLVFAGRMSLTRREAVRHVISLGGSVGSRVTPHTTTLVVAPKPGGPHFGQKEKVALELKDQGHAIRLISETEFYGLVGVG